MKYDYWKMRGWTLVQTDDADEDLKAVEDNFGSVEEIVKSIDDIFEILQETLGDDDAFVIEIGIIEDDDKKDSKDDAYDRAMKGM